ncbi:MAG: ABC-F family ATP-binding cassette domain-containing protein [Firmicutes bacterium]|nr:ABC-F family ATP-binding cassette domain-containing protein [Bacillota bacterium]
MLLLEFNDLVKSYNGKTVFTNASGKIYRGDRIGLTGANGSGKTTLLNILAGRESPDAGRVGRLPSSFFYLEQSPRFDSGNTVLAEILQFAEREKHNAPPAVLGNLAQKALLQAGLSDSLFSRKIESLSGGEKTKLALTKALLGECELLILDEPTNYLDTAGLEWLEEFLLAGGKTLLVVSHDRFFLDRVVTKIWEMTPRGLACYEGNYTAYRQQKQNEETYLLKEYEKQQQAIKHLQEVVARQKERYRNAHRAAGQNDFYRAKAKKQANIMKAKASALARLEKEKKEKPKRPVSPAYEIINRWYTAAKMPAVIAHADGLGKAYGGKHVFRDLAFSLRRQDKVAVIGPNGSGKTTLLRIIAQIDRDYEGSLRVSPAVKIGYLSQALDHLHEQASILEEVLATGSPAKDARLLLACLLFRGDDVHKKIGQLSMGEKGRVAFARLILSGATFLVLDEPTNHIDMLSRESIEDVLAAFAGPVLFVSHDRYFIRSLANRIFYLADGKLQQYNGGYDAYLSLHRRRQEAGSATGGQDLADEIRRLENELAYLGGRLDTIKDETEKAETAAKFLATARKLNEYKTRLRSS